MENYIYIALAFVFGYFLACFVNHFFQSKKQSSLLNDFKQSIDDIKIQSKINSTEIKQALESTTNLSKILTTNQNLKGKFGEECLENILNYTYSTANIDYFKQFITKNIDDKQIKPDYIVNLPNKKSIVIDCKLNLEKYIEYKNSINTQLETKAKTDLKQDLNTTINALAQKKYETSKDLIQPSFILMYIPLEPLISLIYTDEDFYSVIKNANEKNIIIVGNSSILTTLRLVRDIWSNEIQNNNLDSIIEIAQNIYNELALHSQKLSKFKALINELNSDFEKEYNKFSSEKNIFKIAQKLSDFGIQSKNSKIGKKMIENVISNEFID